MVRIYIENQELDVNQDFTHQITYAIDDIRNIDSKATTFTKTIVLPGTAKNNKLLGNIFELTNANFTNSALPNVGYNFNAAKSAAARIEMDGLQVMKGVMRLMQIVIDGNNIEYEIALFGELGGFITAMGSKKLVGNEIVSDDLDMSEYDHVYDITNIETSWNGLDYYNATNGSFNSATYQITVVGVNLNYVQVGDSIVINGTPSNDGTYTISSITNTWLFVPITILTVAEPIVNESNVGSFTINIGKLLGRGYVYPLIDYGNVSPEVPGWCRQKIDYQYRAFRPAFYVREIVEKIISAAGYTYESNFFNTDFFNRLIVPNNEKGLLRMNESLYIDAYNDGDSFIYTGDVAFSKLILFTTTSITSFTYSSGTYTYTGSLPTTTKINLRIDCDVQIAPFTNVFITVYTTGGTVASYLLNAYNGRHFSIASSGQHTFNNGDQLYIRIGAFGNPRMGLSCHITNIQVAFTVVQDPATSIPYEYGDTLNMSKLLPKNIFQKDFIISLMKMFNLYIQEDRYREKHLIIEPYVDFYDTGNYLNWTEKVDRSKPVKIKPMSELSARYYEFKYKSDTDYYNDKYRKTYFEGYGDRVYDNEFEFVQDKQTMEVLFAATPLVGYVIGSTQVDKIVSAIYKMNNNVEEATESVIRILQFKLIEGVSNWYIQNQNTNLGNYTVFPYAGHLDNPDAPNADLNFGATKELYFTLAAGALSNNMFNAYYSPYMAEITDKDSRLVTATMKFSNIDISKLDFKRLIYIDNVVYRLSKIMDYAENELAQTELLRVINTTYFDIAPPVLELGQEYQGGTIAWLDETGQHGLIKANIEYNNSYPIKQWSNDMLFTISTNSSYGYGSGNTNLIVSADASTDNGAGFCQTLDSGGYTDWFLPTTDELSNIWSAGQIPTEWNLTGLIWTSMTNDIFSAVALQNADGSLVDTGRDFVTYILPCRYF